MDNKYLNVKSVAKRYDIGVSTVWLRVQQGKIPKPVKIHENSTRWRASDLDAADERALEL